MHISKKKILQERSHYDGTGSSIIVQSPPLVLVPPSLPSGTEIIFRPRRKHDLAVVSDVAVGQGERKGSRSAHHGTIGSVLRSVAGAHELVVGGRPRDDATQVGADRVQTVRFEGLVILHNQVTAVECSESLAEWQKKAEKTRVSPLFP